MCAAKRRIGGFAEVVERGWNIDLLAWMNQIMQRGTEGSPLYFGMISFILPDATASLHENQQKQHQVGGNLQDAPVRFDV